jgi:hypothetical protein
MSNTSYVYRHIRSDTHEVFYVGIGRLKDNKRAHQISKSRNPLWKNIVSKTKFSVEIIAQGLSWELACELESLLISEYGRRDIGTGILVNMTDGGDGHAGMSQECKDSISKKLSGRTVPGSILIKRAKTQKELWNSDEYAERREVQKQRAIRLHKIGTISRKGQPSKKKGIPLSDEVKEKVSLALKKHYETNKSKCRIDISKEKIELICSDYANGDTIFKLHKRYNLNRKVVDRIIRENVKNKQDKSDRN